MLEPRPACQTTFVIGLRFSCLEFFLVGRVAACVCFLGRTMMTKWALTLVFLSHHIATASSAYHVQHLYLPSRSWTAETAPQRYHIVLRYSGTLAT
ncbi:hypothetical protein F5B21DRAFT_491500 [Xylaria acuta]|nr:hypothetical protein F5B21DRAFT_491500 [Xylaria acuta]